MAYHRRHDWRLKGNDDALDIYLQNMNARLPYIQREFAFDYEVTGIELEQVKLGKTWDLRDANRRGGVLDGSFSLLRGLSLKKESFAGRLDANQQMPERLTLDSYREVYSSELKPGSGSGSLLGVFEPFDQTEQGISNGSGYGVDLGFTYYFSDHTYLGFVVNDAFARIKWKSLAHIVQRNGYLDYLDIDNPYYGGYSGLSEYSKYTYRLPEKYGLIGEMRNDRITTRIDLQTQQGMWYPHLTVKYDLTANWKMGVQYESRFGTVAISLQHPNFFFALGLDHYDPEQLHSATLSMGLNLFF